MLYRNYTKLRQGLSFCIFVFSLMALQISSSFPFSSKNPRITSIMLFQNPLSARKMHYHERLKTRIEIASKFQFQRVHHLTDPLDRHSATFLILSILHCRLKTSKNLISPATPHRSAKIIFWNMKSISVVQLVQPPPPAANTPGPFAGILYLVGAKGPRFFVASANHTPA